ncbi:AIPR family protein [Defluviimonas sp. WL0050]|uniref:AIPR family protein n=1 Tax=Albidovulum litorale TaxID=2984134 RepID=A0ABT2ZMK1_9RHOB|nr:AIPR family protein [Defluviimonas sp. WL0050]MCV2872368.1 AIPR family protein [Defluviimonas sp. WL0050]
MSDNSQQLLNDVLEQKRAEIAPHLSEQDYFEIFSAEQILKDHDLSYEEIEEGIVDGEHDGGVDSVFIFVNGELLQEDYDISSFKKDVTIELHVIQSKTSGGYSEAPLNNLISATRHLLKLNADYDNLTQYNTEVKKIFDRFRSTYRALASRFPILKIFYYYAAKRSDGTVHENIKKKSEELVSVAKEMFAEAEVEVVFIGARYLLDLARKRPKTAYDLKISKHLSDTDSYIVLSPLKEYVRFLKDSANQVRAELFESNVRDFSGNTEVNAEIVNTLKNESVVDFWWMNNGVTILASRASLNGDTVTLENPQIVNGLQTSTQVAAHFTSTEGDSRSVMVKIISSDDEETRDKIIKATNSQNPVQPATLRATDKVQRDIEQALKSAGMFYDRRKNYYKNEGKPADKIISIPLMAQAVMAVILSSPDQARARPSSLIKDDTVYSKVFSERNSISLYVNSAKLIREVDRILKTRTEMTARDRTNLRFFVLLWVVAWASKKANPSAPDVSALDVSKIGDDQLESAIDEIWKLYQGLGATDQVAKGPTLKNATLDELKRRIEIYHKSKPA